MGVRTTCDGTGVPIPGDSPTTGLFGHQYCPEAREIAEKYLEEVDTLHSAMAETFGTALSEIRARYKQDLLQLPDES